MSRIVKNVSKLGGAVLIAYLGAGPLSLEAGTSCDREIAAQMEENHEHPFPGELNKFGKCCVWRPAILLLAGGVALPAESNLSGSPAEHVKDNEPACTGTAKPNRKAAFSVLGKVNPLRLVERLDTATTDLAIRFSSWHSDLPRSQELPKAAKGNSLDAASGPPARER